MNGVREAIEKLGAKVEIKITIMNQEEQKILSYGTGKLERGYVI